MNLYPKTVSASDLKNNTSEILNLVAYGGYEVVVEKYGEKFVKVVPMVLPKVKKDYNSIIKKFAGSIPDFPDVTKDRKSRKYAKIFD